MGYFEWRALCAGGRAAAAGGAQAGQAQEAGPGRRPGDDRGRTIARSFWGKSWCDNLERYSDYENRLPRGRTYVRNGSVLDLQIAKGKVDGDGRRFRALQGRDHHCAGHGGALEGHLPGLRGSDRFAGRTLQGRLVQRRHGAGLSARATDCFRRPARSSCPAAVRTGPTCASMSRRRSMASAPGSTKSLSFCSCCAVWTRTNCLPPPDRILHEQQRCPVRRKYSTRVMLQRCSGWRWSNSLLPMLLFAPPQNGTCARTR